MNFTSQIRHNPETGKDEKYYRLKESYRNASGNACTRILLNVGFIHGLKPEEIRDKSKGLTYKYEHQGEQELWEDQMALVINNQPLFAHCLLSAVLINFIVSSLRSVGSRTSLRLVIICSILLSVILHRKCLFSVYRLAVDAKPVG